MEKFDYLFICILFKGRGFLRDIEADVWVAETPGGEATLSPDQQCLDPCLDSYSDAVYQTTEVYVARSADRAGTG